jgi:hypothetical protein
MADHLEDPATSGAEPDAPPDPDTAVPDDAADSPRPSRLRRLWRAVRVLVAIVTAIVVGALVSVFSIDLGPSLRHRAETEGSKFIQRPMHIGRLSAKLTPGVFVVEDLVIEGLTPQDRP